MKESERGIWESEGKRQWGSWEGMTEIEVVERVWGRYVKVWESWERERVKRERES